MQSLVGKYRSGTNFIFLYGVLTVGGHSSWLARNGQEQAKEGIGHSPHFEILQAKFHLNTILTEKGLCLQGIFVDFGQFSSLKSAGSG